MLILEVRLNDPDLKLQFAIETQVLKRPSNHFIVQAFLDEYVTNTYTRIVQDANRSYYAVTQRALECVDSVKRSLLASCFIIQNVTIRF